MEIIYSGIKCDCCDYREDDVDYKDYILYINKPCPKCREPLLTRKQYEQIIKIIRRFNIAKRILSIFKWVNPFHYYRLIFGDKREMTTLSFTYPSTSLTEWCCNQHLKVNQKYGDLPYSFHLESVASVAEEFKVLITEDEWETVRLACYGHDLLEDTHNTYNDIKKVLGTEVADIIYAVTNEKGKNRKERTNHKYYEGIRNNRLAVMVKLADRIANVSHALKTKSSMFEMYKKENSDFLKSMGYNKNHEFVDMFNALNNLLQQTYITSVIK